MLYNVSPGTKRYSYNSHTTSCTDLFEQFVYDTLHTLVAVVGMSAVLRRVLLQSQFNITEGHLDGHTPVAAKRKELRALARVGAMPQTVVISWIGIISPCAYFCLSMYVKICTYITRSLRVYVRMANSWLVESNPKREK